MVIRRKSEKVTLNAKKVAIGEFLPQITAKAVPAASLSGSHRLWLLPTSITLKSFCRLFPPPKHHKHTQDFGNKDLYPNC